jgi:hypothetical protein
MNGLASGVKAVKSVSMKIFFRFADWDDRVSTVPPSNPGNDKYGDDTPVGGQTGRARVAPPLH